MIRVLVVDDSPTARTLLTRTLESVPDIQVVGTAEDGEQAVALAMALRPDLITMDVRMPRRDGLMATEEIMASCPTPIVVVSASIDAPDLQITFNALRAGALEVIQKPKVADTPGFETIRVSLIRTVRAMAEVRVVRRRIPPRPPREGEEEPAIPARRFHVIAIGSSTGGPQLLAQFLAPIPAEFPAPILVVQHMAPGFTAGFARWLGGEVKLAVKLAEDGERARPGVVYIAPDAAHLRIDANRTIRLGQEPPIGMFRPSIDALFQSVAESIGEVAAGFLLTGMGSDGAQGLKQMRSAGGWTACQDRESCVVSGMPDAGRAAGAAVATVTPERIPAVLLALTSPR